MPAREETYRNTRFLHIVFAITSVVMTATVVWMIMADHLRPWKQTQRGFQLIETDKLKAQEIEKAEQQRNTEQARLNEIDAEIRRAKSHADTNARKIRDLESQVKTKQGLFEKLDTEVRFKKADLDSRRSLYDGMIDREELQAAKRYIQEVIAPTERDFAKSRLAFEKAQRALYETNLQIGLLKSSTVEISSDPAPGTVAKAAGFQAGDIVSVEDFGLMRKAVIETILGAEPRDVEVTVLRKGKTSERLKFAVRPVPEPSRPADADADWAWVNFGLDVTPQTPDVLAKSRDDLTREVDRIARNLQLKIEQYGQNKTPLGPLYAFFGWVRGLPFLDLMAPPQKIQQISLPELTINYNFKDVPRYDRCTTCHMGIDRLGFDKTADGKPMPTVYHSHPHLNTGATYLNPRGQTVEAGLYLDANGPHPINSFGCTICHGGQGSGTSFTFASHTPNDLHQKEAWHKDLDWHSIHFWDEPMLPKRFMESSCLKCHHLVTDLQPQQAPKLLAGYRRIEKFGCTGCHAIGSEGSFGPDLTDTRQVGPNLKHIAKKASRDWTTKWIKNPHAFRPDSRMPRFYDLTNNDHPNDAPKNHAEIHAITHYLFSTSTEPKFDASLPTSGDAAKGKTLFLERGCMACHSDRAYTPADLPKALQSLTSWNPAYGVDAETLNEPSSFPPSVQKFANADFGPNLSSMAAKFPTRDQGQAWLTNWIFAPESYHNGSLMPNLQLAPQEAADLAAFILSARADWNEGGDASLWPVSVDIPAVDAPEVQKAIDELMNLYLSRAKIYNKRTLLEREIPEFVKELSTNDKLYYLGERTISRLGCFGCHQINGFDNAKPIGTPLDGWGFKSPAKLDYSHISEYLVDHAADEEGARDGTDEYYQEELSHQTRAGFLFQKLHRPRSYDFRKDRVDIKAWDDRLRMPQFSWADDPKAIEEVMTFVLGLTGEKIAPKYLPQTHYTPAQLALAKGERIIDRNNCKGCHVFGMFQYMVANDKQLDKVFRSADANDPGTFMANVTISYDNRAKDHRALFPQLSFAAGGKPTIEPPSGAAVILEGMPIGMDDEDGDEKTVGDRTLYVQLFEPVKIRGYEFGVGDTVRLNPAEVETRAPDGGNFAWLYSEQVAAASGEPMATLWNKLPPPLLREGFKVQTPWLTSFLHDPYKIRPAAQLRMPRFHWGGNPTPGITRKPDIAATETRDVANFFAARDNAVFPYQDIPQREQAYLSEMDSLFAATPGTLSPYLNAGWTLITKNQCVQCHAIGQFKPTGEEKSHGPNLRQVSTRLRPQYMLEWIANPTRFLPYTAMPQVFPPPGGQAQNPVVGVPKELEKDPLDQIRAVRDMLLNFVTAVEQQLATVAPPPEPPPAAAAAAPAAAPGANP